MRRRCLPRAAVVLVATAALALFTTACGSGSPKTRGSGSSDTSASAGQPSALAFARCMRTHGVEHWPDPGSNGHFDKSKLTLRALGVTQPQLQAAQRPCQHLYPNVSGSSQGGEQQMMDAMFRFARCVRARGVPKWPDPLAESDPGQPDTPGFPRNMPDVNQNAPQVKRAMRDCQHLMAGIGYGSGGYP